MFMSYDADGDGMVNEAEYGDGVNFGGVLPTTPTATA